MAGLILTINKNEKAAFLLLSPKRLPQTTGQVIHVDGGLADGFLR